MNELNWSLIAMVAMGPVVPALVLAVPLWRRGQPILGNIAGATVIFLAAFAAIFGEHVELDRAVQTCIDAGTTCWPEPSAFTRYAIYASIGMAEVFALFTVSLMVETRLRRRDYAPEWR